MNFHFHFFSEFSGKNCAVNKILLIRISNVTMKCAPLLFAAVIIMSVCISFFLYIRVAFKYPLIFYAPGVLARMLRRTQSFKGIEWKSGVSRRTSELSDLPDIILIVADDLGYNDLSGGVGVATPRIDSIKNQGVVFTQAYAGHATCSPSRASLLTGRFPARFGFDFTSLPMAMSWAISRNDEEDVRKSIFHTELIPKIPAYANMIVPLNETMLSNVLKDSNDYSTIYVGKWHLGEVKGSTPLERGFDETLTILKGASLYQPIDHPDIVNAPLGGMLDDFLFHNLAAFVSFNGDTRFETPQYMTDFLAEEAASAVKAKAETRAGAGEQARAPYFMMVGFNAPHSPLQAKRSDYDSPLVKHISDHKQRVYAAMILALDRGVGTILDAVQASGNADNTLVIFTSDNGGPGYLGMPEVNAPFRGWKATFFEGGVRVPLFMSWPRVIPSGTSYDRPVSHVDAFATAAAAGRAVLPTDREYDGVNLIPLLPSKQSSVLSIASESRDEEPHKLLFWRSGHYLAARSSDVKLQVSERPDKVWMVDMSRDGTERINLVEGLLWSTLREILRANKGRPAGCEAEVMFHLGEAKKETNVVQAVPMSELRMNQTTIASSVCSLGHVLVDFNGQMHQPLWPALAEIAVAVDAATKSVLSTSDEYVYWAN